MRALVKLEPEYLLLRLDVLAIEKQRNSAKPSCLQPVSKGSDSDKASALNGSECTYFCAQPTESVSGFRGLNRACGAIEPVPIRISGLRFGVAIIGVATKRSKLHCMIIHLSYFSLDFASSASAFDPRLLKVLYSFCPGFLDLLRRLTLHAHLLCELSSKRFHLHSYTNVLDHQTNRK